jgi:hypothetical protein
LFIVVQRFCIIPAQRPFPQVRDTSPMAVLFLDTEEVRGSNPRAPTRIAAGRAPLSFARPPSPRDHSLGDYGRTLYVTTDGGLVWPPDGIRQPARLLRVKVASPYAADGTWGPDQLRNHLRVVAGHELGDLLPSGRSRGLKKPAHLLEVAEIASRREGAEETSGPLRWIAEGVRHPDGHHHERSPTGPHGFRSHHELQLAFEDVEALLMRMVDMRLRDVMTLRGQLELGEAQLTPSMGPVLLHDHPNVAKPKFGSFASLHNGSIHHNVLSRSTHSTVMTQGPA